MPRNTEGPVEESEGEEAANKFAHMRHRRIRVTAHVRCAWGIVANEQRWQHSSRPCSFWSRARHCLPNGLPAPLIC